MMVIMAMRTIIMRKMMRDDNDDRSNDNDNGCFRFDIWSHKFVLLYNVFP